LSSSSKNARHVHGSDLRGIGQLCISALGGAIDVVEGVHLRLVRPRRLAGAAARPAAYVYRRLRRASELAGRWLDTSHAGPAPALASTSQREAMLAALNGVFGDRLEEAGNLLTIPMRLRREGRALELDRASLAASIPQATGKLLVLVHGLCHNDLQWQRNGHDHGAALARDLGYTPVYLHYNSGRHISTNGRQFSRLLEKLVANWPVEVEELAIIGYSMGGLVSRSACHYGKLARARWLRKLRHMVFMGTPHHGVPLERGGNWLVETIGSAAVMSPLARIARLRSAGITDLRHGSLVDEDWHGVDRFAHRPDERRHVPLPRRVRCHNIAVTTGRREGDLRDRLLGDGIVPLQTALGRHPEPARTLRFGASSTWVGLGLHHLDLLSDPQVYETIRQWLGQPGDTSGEKSSGRRLR
jgi:hypothetical protein